MGKINEIQEEVKQSFGSNSFTTTVKENTVEFDSAKDSFTFKDAVEVPSLKVNGQEVSGANADWNAKEGEPGYIENKPFYEEGSSEILFQGASPNMTAIVYDGPALVPGKSYRMKFNASWGSSDETVVAVALMPSDPEAPIQIQNSMSMNFQYYPLGGAQGDPTKKAYVGFPEGTLLIQEVPTVVPVPDKYIPQLGGVQFKIDGTSLKVSLNSGTTWKTVSIS